MTRVGQPSRNYLSGQFRAVRDVLARKARLVTGAAHAVLRLTTVAAAMFEVFPLGHVAHVTGDRVVQLARNTERQCGGETLSAATSAFSARGVYQFQDARANKGARLPSSQRVGGGSARG